MSLSWSFDNITTAYLKNQTMAVQINRNKELYPLLLPMVYISFTFKATYQVLFNEKNVRMC